MNHGLRCILRVVLPVRRVSPDLRARLLDQARSDKFSSMAGGFRCDRVSDAREKATFHGIARCLQGGTGPIEFH